MPATDITFFLGLIGVLLIAGGSNMSRLLLARGYATRAEMGIHRALGATRADLFLRTMVEGGLMALPAVLIGLCGGWAVLALHHRTVDISGIPVRFSTAALVASLGTPFLVGLLSTVYPAWRSSRTGPTVSTAKQ